MSYKEKEFEEYSCKYRDEEGCCGLCAYICECSFPDLCKERKSE